MPPAWSPTTRYPSANATDDELPRGASGSCCSNLPVEASHAYRFPSHVLRNTVPLLYAGEVPTAPPGMKLSQTTAPVFTSNAIMSPLKKSKANVPNMTSPSATTGVEVSISGPSPGVDQIRAPVSASRAFIVPVPSPTYTTPPATAGAATTLEGTVVCQIRLPVKASRARQ